MIEFIPILSCLLAGLMATLHPCPLTTNMAAVSLLSTVKKNRLLSYGLAFIAGTLTAFILLGIILTSAGQVVPALATAINRLMGIILGPVLILVGMLHCDLLPLKNWTDQKLARFASGGSLIQYYMMGIIIAFSFCPATAGLFFGVLVPLAFQHDAPILFPVLYALGAVLPLVVMVIIIQRGSRLVLKKNNWEKLSYVAGLVLILVGIYITVDRIYLQA